MPGCPDPRSTRATAATRSLGQVAQPVCPSAFLGVKEKSHTHVRGGCGPRVIYSSDIPDTQRVSIRVCSLPPSAYSFPLRPPPASSPGPTRSAPHGGCTSELRMRSPWNVRGVRPLDLPTTTRPSSPGAGCQGPWGLRDPGMSSRVLSPSPRVKSLIYAHPNGCPRLGWRRRGCPQRGRPRVPVGPEAEVPPYAETDNRPRDPTGLGWSRPGVTASPPRPAEGENDVGRPLPLVPGSERRLLNPRGVPA